MGLLEEQHRAMRTPLNKVNYSVGTFIIVKMLFKLNNMKVYIKKKIIELPSHSEANELQEAVNSALSIAKSLRRSISDVSVATAIITLQTRL